MTAGNLRKTVLRGGAYLSVRQVLGTALSLGGVILLTRAIGPADFGIYASALGIFTFLQNVTQGGIRAYLVRREGEDREEIYHQAFTLLLLFGLVGTLLICSMLPLLDRWVRMDNFAPVAFAVFMSLPVTLLTRIPLARLERALDYKRVAMLEFSSLLIYYLVALALAFSGFGVAAPVAGWWAQQLSLLILVYCAVRYYPRLHWDRKLASDMVGYGLSFSASSLVFQMRELVNPLVVGRFLGAEAAGYVALTVRLAKRLTIAKETAWRLSMPALARLQQDKPRMVRAVTEGMKLQLLALGPLLVGFGWIASWFLPLAFGADWLPVAEIYPFIAVGYLVNAMFSLHATALNTLRRNLKVVSYSLTNVILFAGSAYLLVPSVGLVGYGLAELIALPSYLVIHINFARVVGSPAYLTAGVWAVAAGLAIFVHELGWWVVLAPMVVVLWPRTWHEIGGYARAIWKAREA